MNKGFQRKVIAAFLIGECQLPPSDLFDPPLLTHLVEAAQRIIDAGATRISTEALLEEASRNLPVGVHKSHVKQEVKKIQDCTGDNDIPYVVSRVSEMVLAARVQRALPIANQAVKDGNVDHAVTVLEEALRANTSNGKDSDGFTKSLGSKILITPEETTERVPTGIWSLDKLFSGGLGGGELGIVVAPPSRGKSTVLVSFGASAIRWGKRVVHFSLEMSAASIERRYMCNLTRKTHQEVMANPYRAGQMLKREMGKSGGSLRVYSYPPKSVTVRDLLPKVGDADLVIIDYGALLRASNSFGDRRFDIASAMTEMRGLAVRENIPVWTAHQTNRAAVNKKDKEIDMADLAECFEVGAIADSMFSINMDEMDYEEGIARLFVMKNRYEQALVTRKVYVDWPTYSISDKAIE